MRIQVLADASAVAHALAEEITRLAQAVLADHDRFCVALAGGSTPRAAYQLLATPSYRERIEWPRVEIFFGDERCVPPDHPDANYRMAREALLDHVPLAADHVHRIPGERPPEEAAGAYEALLRRVLPPAPEDDPPRLDLVLLGMGADGHTASLFPGTPAVDETRALCAAVWVPKLAAHRVSLTLPVLCAAAHVFVVAVGAEKAGAVAAARSGPSTLPVARVRPSSGQLTWILDEAAAAELPRES